MDLDITILSIGFPLVLRPAFDRDALSTCVGSLDILKRRHQPHLRRLISLCFLIRFESHGRDLNSTIAAPDSNPIARI